MSKNNGREPVIETLKKLKRESQEIFFLTVDFTNKLHSLPIQNIINSPGLLPQARVLQNTAFLMDGAIFDKLQEVENADNGS